MSHTNLTVYGATWCSDCKRAEKFLGEQRVHYNWIDVEQEAEGLAFFVFTGLLPNSGQLPAEIQRDPAGFIIARTNLETSLPGVFAAGDVRLGSTKQAAGAAGEGATAALMGRDYLKTIQADCEEAQGAKTPGNE